MAQFEKYKFSPVNFDLLDTGNVGICYSKGGLLPDTEILVERIEADRIGFPKDYEIATHIWGIIKPIQDVVISRSQGIWKFKHTETLILKAGIAYVFEETVRGVECSEARLKYGNATNIEVLTRVDALDIWEKQYFQEQVIKYWKESKSYGFGNFANQILHVLGKDLTKRANDARMICSEFYAVIANDLRRFMQLKKPLDFPNEANVNPFEWQISNIWIRDIKVQPL